MAMISFDVLLDAAAECSSVSAASRSEYASLETPAYVVCEDFNWNPATPMVYQPVFDPSIEEDDDENFPMIESPEPAAENSMKPVKENCVKSPEPAAENLVQPVKDNCVKSPEPAAENLMKPVTVKENLMKLKHLKPPETISESDNFQFKIPSSDLKFKLGSRKVDGPLKTKDLKSTRRDGDSKSKSCKSESPKNDLKFKSTHDSKSKSLKPKDLKCKFPKNDLRFKLGSRKNDDLKVESLKKTRRDDDSKLKCKITRRDDDLKLKCKITRRDDDSKSWKPRFTVTDYESDLKNDVLTLHPDLSDYKYIFGKRWKKYY